MKLGPIVPSLGVSDVERSVAFYKDVLGLEIVDSYAPEGRLLWCHLRGLGPDGAATRLMLQQLSAEQQEECRLAGPKSFVLYVSPQTIGYMHRELKVKGHDVSELETGDYEEWEFFLSDPDGYELWFSASAPPS